MREVLIGEKSLRDLSAEDLRQIVMIEGCCPGREYWCDPVVSEFDNTMFGNCCLIHYASVRKSDGYGSKEYWFFFDYDLGSYFYVSDAAGASPRNSPGCRPSMATLRYLIQEGFDVPL